MRPKQPARVGQRVREPRKSKSLSQRALGSQVGVSFTHVSKIENEKLDFGDYPSEELIRKLARALDVDEDDLPLLAEKIPADILGPFRSPRIRHIGDGCRSRSFPFEEVAPPSLRLARNWDVERLAA